MRGKKMYPVKKKIRNVKYVDLKDIEEKAPEEINYLKNIEDLKKSISQIMICDDELENITCRK
jgi:hypothetical protein